MSSHCNPTIAKTLVILCCLAVAFAMAGCPDIPDRSLNIVAFSPANQNKTGAIQSMEIIKHLRVGVFQKQGLVYTPVIEPLAFEDVEAGQELKLPNVPTSDNELIYVIEGFCEETPSHTSQALLCNSLAAQFQPTTDSDGRTRQMLNMGDCRPNGAAQPVTPEDPAEAETYRHVLMRGISAPFIYNGEDRTVVKVMLARTNWFAEFPEAPGSDDRLELQTSRQGHGTILLPNGELLIVGGTRTQQFGGANAISGIASKVELLNLGDLKSKEIDGSVPVAYATVTPFNEDFLPQEDENGNIGMATEVRFLVAGGVSQYNADGSFTLSDKVMLCTYNTEDEKLDVQQIGAMTGGAVYKHAATYLFDGYVLITGGMLQNGQPSNNAYLVNMAEGQMIPMPAMNEARYSHTASYLGGNIIVAAGYGETTESNTRLTTGSVEVWTPGTDGSLNTGVFSLVNYDVPEDAEKVFSDVSRAEHIAVPIIDPDTSKDSRLVVLGGMKVALAEAGNTTETTVYGANGKTMVMVYLDANGKWTADREEQAGPYVNSAWTFLKGSHDTIIVTGGTESFNPSGVDETTTRTDFIRFAKTSSSYSDMGNVLVNSDIEARTPYAPDPLYFNSQATTLVYTLYKSDGQSTWDDTNGDPVTFTLRMPKDSKGIDGSMGPQGMSKPRRDHTITAMDDGTYVVIGGFTSISTQGQSIGNVEMFVPPSRNRWGGLFQVVPEI